MRLPSAIPAAGRPICSYRKDRFECSKGAELLKSHKLKDISPTNRVVATCCNSAMSSISIAVRTGLGRTGARFHGELPPLQARICTKFKPEGVVLSDDVPSYRSYPPGLMVKLLRLTRIAMALGR